MKQNLITSDDFIKNKIHYIRGIYVLLDRDLAKLYEVETRDLNKAVKRNIERFPEDFMFQLTKKELLNWKFHFGTSNSEKMGLRKSPYAFTEQGVATLSGILRSKKAIEVNIKIMRAFISMRKFLIKNQNIIQKFQKIDEKFYGRKFIEVEDEIKFLITCL